MLRVLIVSALVLGSSLASRAGAEVPSGSYAIQVGGDHAIFMPTGVGSPSCETADGSTVCFSGAISTDGSGGVTGTALAELAGGVEGSLAGTLAGRFGGSAANTRLRLAMTMRGEVSSVGGTLDVAARGRLRCDENELAGGFRCSGRMRCCFSDAAERLGCESQNVALSLGDAGGPWLLLLALETTADRDVGGTALVALAGGQLFDYQVTGRYSARTDTARLRLVGTGDAQGSRLELSRVSLAGGAADAGTLRYRIAGQTGRMTLPPPASSGEGNLFPGHGTCLHGGFCDTNADTSSFFTGQNPRQFVFDDTIFFGILGAASRLH